MAKLADARAPAPRGAAGSLNLRLTPLALEVLFRDLAGHEAEAETHPPEEDVVRYLNGEANAAIETHLDVCEPCLARASSLADDLAGERRPSARTAPTAPQPAPQGLAGSNVEPRELLLANLALLRPVVQFLARRYRLAPGDADELESLVRLRLVEDDYAILRQWSRNCTLQTYLTIVVQRIFHDYRNRQWGEWRSSAAALRLGPLAQALEELIYRDGLSFAEASQVLISQRAVEADVLARLYQQLPPRPGRRPVTIPVADPPLDPEQAARQRVSEEVLTASLRRLDAQDRLLLRLHFGEGLSVAAVSQVMEVPQKSLYKRFAAVLKSIRRRLRAAGIERGNVLQLLPASSSEWLTLSADARGDEEEGATD